MKQLNRKNVDMNKTLKESPAKIFETLQDYLII